MHLLHSNCIYCILTWQLQAAFFILMKITFCKNVYHEWVFSFVALPYNNLFIIICSFLHKFTWQLLVVYILVTQENSWTHFLGSFIIHRGLMTKPMSFLWDPPLKLVEKIVWLFTFLISLFLVLFSSICLCIVLLITV